MISNNKYICFYGRVAQLDRATAKKNNTQKTDANEDLADNIS